jgi:hypothetical protein
VAVLEERQFDTKSAVNMICQLTGERERLAVGFCEPTRQHRT